MEITLIWAMDPRGGIGRNNLLPWNYPEDLRRFKKLTLHHPVVMGRKTFNSLPAGPLPERQNIVLSRNPPKESVINRDGALWFRSVQDVIDWGRKNKQPQIFVIGGKQIYGEFLPRADRLEVTRIKRLYPCDCYFPDLNWSEWERIFSDDRDEFVFESYVRTALTR